MKRNDHHTPARLEQLITVFQKTLESFQFAVDRNSQRLKSLRCRMMSTVTLPLHSHDDIREIDRGLDCSIFSLRRNRRSDATRPGLFAIVADDFGYLRLGKGVDDFKRCQPLAAVHAHVQWSAR